MNDYIDIFSGLIESHGVYVFGYFVSILIGYIIYKYCVFLYMKCVNNRRKKETLPGEFIENPYDYIKNNQYFLYLQLLIFFLLTIVIPFNLIIGMDDSGKKNFLLIILLSSILWFIISGTNLFKTVASGFAFKNFFILKKTVQIGDTIKIDTVTGKIVNIDSFYVTLQTVDEDQVNFSSANLWGKNWVLIGGKNKGEISVINFYIGTTVSTEQLQQSENFLWNAMQASVYLDFTKPMQVYWEQKPYYIQLTARAYVTSPNIELLFKSDVTRLFLDNVLEKKIPLAQCDVS